MSTAYQHVDDPRLARLEEIKLAAYEAIARAGDEGIQGSVLSHRVLSIYGDQIDGPDLTMLLCDLALRGQIGYTTTEDGHDPNVLVALERE